jgi:hypothetical protein
MEKLFYEVQFRNGITKTTTNHDEAIDALRQGIDVVEIQESTFFTTDSVVRTTVSRELKGTGNS